MKKRLPSLFFLACIGVASYSQSGIELDNEAGNSMKPIVSDLSEVIETFEQDSLEIVHIEFDLAFSDRPRELYRTLHTGYTYGVFAYGDYRIVRLGLRIYRRANDSWELLRSGEVSSKTNTTSLLIEIDETGQYKIEVTGDEMAEGHAAGHYALYIIHN